MIQLKSFCLLQIWIFLISLFWFLDQMDAMDYGMEGEGSPDMEGYGQEMGD